MPIYYHQRPRIKSHEQKTAKPKENFPSLLFLQYIAAPNPILGVLLSLDSCYSTLLFLQCRCSSVAAFAYLSRAQYISRSTAALAFSCAPVTAELLNLSD